MWNAMESMSGWIWTMATSVPSSLVYCSKWMRRGSFSSMNLANSSLYCLKSSSFPSFKVYVLMKMSGSTMMPPFFLNEFLDGSIAPLNHAGHAILHRFIDRHVGSDRYSRATLTDLLEGGPSVNLHRPLSSDGPNS